MFPEPAISVAIMYGTPGIYGKINFWYLNITKDKSIICSRNNDLMLKMFRRPLFTWCCKVNINKILYTWITQYILFYSTWLRTIKSFYNEVSCNIKRMGVPNWPESKSNPIWTALKRSIRTLYLKDFWYILTVVSRNEKASTSERMPKIKYEEKKCGFYCKYLGKRTA